MKTFLYTTMMLALCTTANAQSAYDAQNMANSDLNGTARYIGMGGALGALGADLSTMGNNPAGTGLYRRSDASFTFGGVFTGNAGAMGHDRGRMSFDQAGVLFALGGTGGDLRNINFGVNYQKKRNFLSNFSGDLNLGGGSQTFQLAEMATDAYYDDNNFGILADHTAPMRNATTGELVYDGIFDDNYVAWKDGVNKDFQFIGVPASSSNYRRATYGSNSQIDLNLSANIADRFFAGIAVGIYTMGYDREAAYSEKTDYADYTIRNRYHYSADGVDVKFGVIFRPIEDSPFRFGLTAHTPIWYKVRDYNSLSVNANTIYNHTIEGNWTTEEFEYNFRTPWKFGVSLGHTVGTFLALGAEYEYSDLPSCKYYYNHSKGYASDFDPQNGNIKANLKGQHTVKLGVEAKPDDAFSVRVGYNFVSSPFKNDAYNHLDYNSSFTETDYTNWKAIHRITFGLGYRYKGGYIDLAYQYQAQNGDFYAYDYEGNYAAYSETGAVATPTPMRISNNRSQIVATLGFKF
ncbi:MAG: hypothetical protein IJV06_03215 [Bacteroidaceae bacterium]|nr:hypothetical protein [Bacteroidaceae bacterium]